MTFAAILQGLAALAWPVVVLVISLVYRDELRSLSSRLRKGKLFGQEIELSDQLDHFQDAVAKVAEQSPPLTHDSAAPPRLEASLRDPVSAILGDAGRSPRAALLALDVELQHATDRIMAMSGWHRGRSTVPVELGIEEMKHSLPPNASTSIKLFKDIRNEIIHGKTAVEDADILRAIDSGVVLLQAMRSIPLEKNRVYHPGVPIYSDPECSTPWPEGRGVILETVSAGGASKTFRIYPTRVPDYKTGSLLSWEWDSSHIWGQTWYRKPDTQEILKAWDSSLGFSGRVIPEPDDAH